MFLCNFDYFLFGRCLKQTEQEFSVSLFAAPQEHHQDPPDCVFSASDFLYCVALAILVIGDSEVSVLNVALLFSFLNIASVLSAMYPTAYNANVDNQEKSAPIRNVNNPYIKFTFAISIIPKIKDTIKPIIKKTIARVFTLLPMLSNIFKPPKIKKCAAHHHAQKT